MPGKRLFPGYRQTPPRRDRDETRTRQAIATYEPWASQGSLYNDCL